MTRAARQGEEAGLSGAEDPRHRNQIFDTSSVGAYLADYAAHLKAALEAVDPAQLDRARSLIEGAAAAGKRLFAIGNGGSAAIADHLTCDLTKGTACTGHPVVDTTSLAANMPLYSAIANDFGFEMVFAHQLRLVGRAGDVLIAISSSGNSANIVTALEAAREIGIATIGLTGFSGGALRAQADVSLHAPIDNYGVVEDAHQALMHILAQFIAKSRDG
jgi:D-sedoheptulose 7-phosphate isomerase